MIFIFFLIVNAEMSIMQHYTFKWLFMVVFWLIHTGSKSGGQELKMEMAQEGFSAAYVPQVICLTES